MDKSRRHGDPASGFFIPALIMIVEIAGRLSEQGPP
jgi:hypothetical protein